MQLHLNRASTWTWLGICAVGFSRKGSRVRKYRWFDFKFVRSWSSVHICINQLIVFGRLLSFTAFHLLQQWDDFFGLLSWRLIMVCLKLNQFLIPNLCKQLLRLHKWDLHPWINLCSLLLFTPCRLFSWVDHRFDLIIDLGVECALEVLSLIPVVLHLLLALVQEMKVLLDVHCSQPIKFRFLH
jgi:hypothetical protein